LFFIFFIMTFWILIFWIYFFDIMWTIILGAIRIWNQLTLLNILINYPMFVIRHKKQMKIL
jgi:TM2 domain-containing membrane protein YozV